MPNAKRIVAYLRSETEFSGVASYPVAIKDIAEELSIDADSLLAELKALRNQGILAFFAVGDTSVRLLTR